MKKLLGACVLLACLSAPSLSSAQFSKPGSDTQVRLGEDAARQLRSQGKVLPDDDPRVVELRKVATRLLGTLHDNEPWQFSFDVIDSPEVNAFALPGGPTFFFTGLMDKLKTEDELAGVLGHELTHVRKEHWAIQYAASQRRGLLINLGLVLLHANQEVGEVAGISEDLLFNLPFSRSEESQADDGGFDMIVGAGYNPTGMIHVFQMLQDTSHGGNPPEFLSDHPADGKRIRHLEDRLKAVSQKFPPERSLGY